MRNWWLMAALALASGCLQVKDELTLAPDGSGTVRIETVTALPAEALEMMLQWGLDGKMPVYPPLSDRAAHRFFGPGATVRVTQEEAGSNGTKVVVTAAFRDVNALLASPYGKARALTVRVEGGVLTVRAISGLELLTRLSDVRDEEELPKLMDGMPGLAEAKQQKTAMRHEFSIGLPGAITATTGTKAGNRATWVLERAKAPDDAAFCDQLATVVEVSCAAAGVTMQPAGPVRLNVAKFADLASGPVGGATPVPAADKVVAAAQFEPLALVVRRSVDLAGEGESDGSRAQLWGEVAVPGKFAPARWGRTRLTEVVDRRGKSWLSQRADEEEMVDAEAMAEEENEEDAPADEEEEARERVAKPKVADTMARRRITLPFTAPDWKTKELARIKGVVTLEYAGASAVVKAPQVIAAADIMDEHRPGERRRSLEERQLVAPDLAKAGWPLMLWEAQIQGPVTMLQLRAEGAKGLVTDAQVFDATGRPWPTMFQVVKFGDTVSLGLVVAGQPAGPLSLALVVSDVGASIEVPITLENVPVN